jgi:hypothetical protein
MKRRFLIANSGVAALKYPYLIGWEGGQPLILKDGRNYCLLSGIRGYTIWK